MKPAANKVAGASISPNSPRRQREQDAPATHKKPTLTPKLRFPEFRGAPGWEEVPLKQVAHINPSGDDLPESFIYIDLESVEAGELKAKNRISRQGAPSRAQRLLRNGDVIFQMVRPYQRNNLFCVCEDADAYVASTGYAQLRARQSDRFLYHAVHNDTFVSAVMAKCTGSNYPAINSAALAEINLPVPSSPPEQRKIASCLSSLDDLIAAERQKLNALKVHKQGLMQQLFPREGKTRPRLRFPEFQDAPEWETMKVDALVDTVTPPKKLPTALYSPKGAFPIVDQSQDAICGWTDDLDAVLREGLPLVIFGDHTCVLKLVDQPFAQGADGIKILSARANVDARFLYQFLCHAPVVTEEYKRHYSILKEKPVHFPDIKTGEQHRIATCLSSLDDLIAAQSAKVAALKTHKKGLMQQLFPAPEAVEA